MQKHGTDTLARLRTLATFLVGRTLDGPTSAFSGSATTGVGVLAVLQSKQCDVHATLSAISDELAGLEDMLCVEGTPTKTTRDEPSYTDAGLAEMLAKNGFAEDLD